MSMRRQQGTWIAIAVGTGCLFFAEPAVAQRTVPVIVQNGENRPVPVYPAGRQPYQFRYSVTSVPGDGERCESIPVPEGMVLTVRSIGVDLRNDSTDTTPDVYVRIARSQPGLSVSDLFRGTLTFIETTGSSRIYRGIYNLELLVGPATGEARYSASICVTDPPLSAVLANRAEGVVSGYVEPTVIVDGNTLP